MKPKTTITLYCNANETIEFVPNDYTDVCQQIVDCIEMNGLDKPENVINVEMQVRGFECLVFLENPFSRYFTFVFNWGGFLWNDNLQRLIPIDDYDIPANSKRYKKEVYCY